MGLATRASSGSGSSSSSSSLSSSNSRCANGSKSSGLESPLGGRIKS